MQYYELMKNASERVGMEFNEDKYKKFMLYKDLLKEWNEKINLTAITEDEDIVKKHFIDCINAFEAEQFKTAKTIIDVGTGAGFPGLPIAIMRDDVEVTLLDALNKRINFLNIVINSLGLKNIRTIHARAEEGSRQKELRQSFDIATSRAVANMSMLSEFCIPYVKTGGYFIALKGPNIEEELVDGRNAVKTLGGVIEEVKPVKIEETDLNHNLVIVKIIKGCGKTYPRNMGNIKRKPLK
ncbi:16S rRNA (guanine(527)-N(7))-methyltransferase RsmG [Clostridium massiliamazoniense]|uniref:16S rRNA (guanine(527)-N(7))-methyltransferase RsmG n=1 Tax=Clostridium massiliamazoniense TaxID=1347366 RepID=UPI0006D7C3DF|nr:16S rRNA (guanine(527)-N(7))-methyltransferase RsmG [Clostridium massiliamazoniense]